MLKSVMSKNENMTNELKQNMKLIQNSNETKLKRNNLTTVRVACDNKSIKSKVVDAMNQFNKNVN